MLDNEPGHKHSYRFTEAFGGWPHALSNGGIFILIGLIAAAVIIAVVLLPEAGVDTTPTHDDQEIKIQPASGVEGFPVDEFCVDPLTKVREFPSPDSSGITYQLIRVRDEKTETVVVVMDDREGGTRVATHYYDTEAGQQSEPAVLNAAARECIDRKKGK